MRMPPLPADSIHARACKLKCEKILTRPFMQITVKTDISAKSKNAAERRSQITTQRSGCDLERMSSGVSAL